MISNYLKSAYRSFIRNKFYTILNIIGLSIGLVTFVLLFLYVRDDLNYDRYHENAGRIYRLESDYNISGKEQQFAIVSVPLGYALKLEYAEIESFCRFAGAGNSLFRYGEKENYEPDFYYADSTVFEMFTHKFLLGTPDRCLSEPFQIVITEKVANRYFGKENPIGEILKTGDGESFKVTGVIENLPENSHLKFDALLSGATLAKAAGTENFNSLEPGRFWNIGVYCYVMLNENSSIDDIHAKFPRFYEKYMKPIGDQVNSSFNLLTTPLLKTHFLQGLSGDRPNGNKEYIYLLSAVALFILIIAAINYMNMATARSSNRAKEVGIRKVGGAFKSQLIWQFLSESVILAFAALVIALIAVYILLPDFNMLSGKEIKFDVFTDPVLLLTILLVTAFTGLISGIYPSFYLSSFAPVRVLKGTKSGTGGRSGLLRKILVVFQFWIAIMMIIGTIIVNDQLSFLKTKNLGFKKENLILLELQDTAFRRNAESFKKELLQNPNILSVTNSTGVPGRTEWIQVVRIEKDTQMINDAVYISVVDYDYLSTLGIEIKENMGRDFDKKMGTDKTEAVLVNEALVRQYGWSGDPIGKKIHWDFELDGTGGRVMKVIGVVGDYHFKSLHNEIEPLILFMADFPKYFITARLQDATDRSTLDYIEEKWHKFGARRPFDYRYLDKTWDEMYQAEQKQGIIFKIVTVLTIFIALLGLLGVSSFVAEQRTKEIGVRKVIGATVQNIMTLLCGEFVILITIAFIIAIPFAWWYLHDWLNNNFIYHIVISWWSFLLAGLTAVVIGLITISYYTLRAATSDPVEAIKYE